ncbi:hypothetical protein [Azospirillum sp.]|uniref:hypothetical protein n=1 Tax=Azospirillum sp. TaxID=34012 RepID=UPI003D72774B
MSDPHDLIRALVEASRWPQTGSRVLWDRGADVPQERRWPYGLVLKADHVRRMAEVVAEDGSEVVTLVFERLIMADEPDADRDE